MAYFASIVWVGSRRPRVAARLLQPALGFSCSGRSAGLRGFSSSTSEGIGDKPSAGWAGEGLEAVVDALAKARRVLFVTGAGVSAGSGLPTYRGRGGLYNGHTDEGMPIEEALSASTFRRRPALTWKYLSEIERGCRGARPSRAHEVIAALQLHPRFRQPARSGVYVLTQNVDGLHTHASLPATVAAQASESAGTATSTGAGAGAGGGSADTKADLGALARRVFEMHGSVRHVDCTSPGCGFTQEVADFTEVESALREDGTPACPACRGLLRPRVVLFEEMLPEGPVTRLSEQVRAGFDVAISCGTSSLFQYVTGPLLASPISVEVNTEETALSPHVGVSLRGSADEVLDAVWEQLRPRLDEELARGR